jgi:hypothetical protein
MYFREKHGHLVGMELKLKVVLVLILSLKQAVMLRIIFVNNMKTNMLMLVL